MRTKEWYKKKGSAIHCHYANNLFFNFFLFIFKFGFVLVQSVSGIFLHKARIKKIKKSWNVCNKYILISTFVWWKLSPCCNDKTRFFGSYPLALSLPEHELNAFSIYLCSIRCIYMLGYLCCSLRVQKVTDCTFDMKIKWAQNEVWLIMQNALII